MPGESIASPTRKVAAAFSRALTIAFSTLSTPMTLWPLPAM